MAPILALTLGDLDMLGWRKFFSGRRSRVQGVYKDQEGRIYDREEQG